MVHYGTAYTTVKNLFAPLGTTTRRQRQRRHQL